MQDVTHTFSNRMSHLANGRCRRFIADMSVLQRAISEAPHEISIEAQEEWIAETIQLIQRLCHKNMTLDGCLTVLHVRLASLHQRYLEQKLSKHGLLLAIEESIEYCAQRRARACTSLELPREVGSCEPGSGLSQRNQSMLDLLANRQNAQHLAESHLPESEMKGAFLRHGSASGELPGIVTEPDEEPSSMQSWLQAQMMHPPPPEETFFRRSHRASTTGGKNAQPRGSLFGEPSAPSEDIRPGQYRRSVASYTGSGNSRGSVILGTSVQPQPSPRGTIGTSSGQRGSQVLAAAAAPMCGMHFGAPAFPARKDVRSKTHSGGFFSARASLP